MCSLYHIKYILSRDMILAVSKGSFYSIFYYALNICSAVALCISGKLLQVDYFHILWSSLFDMYAENIFPFRLSRQTYIEYFVKSALSHKLRRKLYYIIGSGNNKGRAVLFLHPCEEVSEKPCCNLCCTA